MEATRFLFWQIKNRIRNIKRWLMCVLIFAQTHVASVLYIITYII